jgi:hypothetical protein
MSGSPARFSKGLKPLLTTFWASRGVPFVVANTSPLSCHPEPALSFSSSCRLRWLLRAVAFVLSGEMAVAYFMSHAPQGF